MDDGTRVQLREYSRSVGRTIDFNCNDDFKVLNGIKSNDLKVHIRQE